MLRAEPLSTHISRSLYRGLCRIDPSLNPTYFPTLPAPIALASHAPSFNKSSDTIPKIIWTYWDSEPVPPFLHTCFHSWRAHDARFETVVLSPRNLLDYISANDLPSTFHALHPTKQSDWLRLYLVSKFGGYWLDASILVTRSLDWLDASRQTHRGEFVGFYLAKFTTQPRYPIIESWAFGAPPGSAFMQAWQREFHRALIEEGTDAYLAHIHQRPDRTAFLQGIYIPRYLLIHVCAQSVLHQRTPYTLTLFKAEDTAYFYQHASHWNTHLLYSKLCLVPTAGELAPLIKLRNGERRRFSTLLSRHPPVPGSVLARAAAGSES